MEWVDGAQFARHLRGNFAQLVLCHEKMLNVCIVVLWKDIALYGYTLKR